MSCFHSIMPEFETYITNGLENTLSTISFGVGACTGFVITLRTLPEIPIDPKNPEIVIPDNLEKTGVGTGVGLVTLIGAMFLKYLENHPSLFLSDPNLDISRYNLSCECCFPVNFLCFTSGVAFGSAIARIASRVVSQRLIVKDEEVSDVTSEDSQSDEIAYDFHVGGFLK